MSATEITVIGNVVDSPRRVRVQTGNKVTNFRLAATERRFDRERQEYIDGNTFWVDVECWGELGGNVSHTVSKGDPVIVVGTISTREWESESGRRSTPQIRAEAVGPNLNRGIADFKRTQRSPVAGQDAAGSEEAPADEGFDPARELVAGVDYTTASEALEQMVPDTETEPAFA